MSKSSSILITLPKVKMNCITQANSHILRILCKRLVSLGGSDDSTSSRPRFRGAILEVFCKVVCGQCSAALRIGFSNKTDTRRINLCPKCLWEIADVVIWTRLTSELRSSVQRFKKSRVQPSHGFTDSRCGQIDAKC